MGKMGARICLFLKWENGIYSLHGTGIHRGGVGTMKRGMV